MSDRKSIFRNNPFVGWFQYSKTFNEYEKPNDLPSNNPFVGTFLHHSKKNEINFQLDNSISKLFLYYKTLHSRPVLMKDVSTQTEAGFMLDELYFIVPQKS